MFLAANRCYLSGCAATWLAENGGEFFEKNLDAFLCKSQCVLQSVLTAVGSERTSQGLSSEGAHGPASVAPITPPPPQ
eukprot:728838-Pleurochrysis_carterae.AAC.2